MGVDCLTVTVPRSAEHERDLCQMGFEPQRSVYIKKLET